MNEEPQRASPISRYRIIFLDFDGPMIPHRAYYLPGNYKQLVSYFDPLAVAFLNYVMEKHSDVRIVISSTWGSQGLKKIQEIFAQNGLNGDRFHTDWITPRRISTTRQFEIIGWLNNHPEIMDYMIIDDEVPEDAVGLKNIIRVTFADGLQFQHYEKMRAILENGGKGWTP